MKFLFYSRRVQILSKIVTLIQEAPHTQRSPYILKQNKNNAGWMAGYLYRKIGGGRQEHQSSNSNTSPAAPIKLVMLNKLGGNEGAYLFFNNLGSVVFLPFSILPGRNFWPPLSIRSSQTTSSQKGNEPFLSEDLHSVRYFQKGKNSAI